MMNNKNDRIEQDGALAKLEGKHGEYHGNSLNKKYLIKDMLEKPQKVFTSKDETNT